MAEEKKGLFKRFFEKVSNWFSPDEDEDEYDEEYEEDAQEEVEEEAVVKTEKPQPKPTKKESTPRKNDDAKSINIRIIKPGDDKSAITTILDSLKGNQVVVVNFEETRSDIRASFADAFAGATYVLGAKYTKLSENTFVLAPNNVSVSPLIAEMAEAASNDSDAPKSYFGSF